MLVERQRPHLLPLGQGVEGKLGAERRHRPDAPGVGQPEDPPAGRRGVVDELERSCAASGCADRDRHGSVDREVDQTRVTAGALVGLGRVLDELEDPGAEIAQHAHEPADLVPRREPRCDGPVVRGLVVMGAGRREAVRAGCERVAQLLFHGGEVVVVGLVDEGALPHRERPQRRVPDVGRVVDALREPVDRVEVFGERGPRPVDPRHHPAGGSRTGIDS